MYFRGLKVGDFAYFERLAASIKVLGRECGRDVNREVIKTKYI
jgi:hypothetical protein